MDEKFAWQLRLQGAPDQVFESLIRAADAEGRLYDVNEVEAALTYATTGVNSDQGGWIRACVLPCPEGALVNIAPIQRQTFDSDAVALQAASVASLIGQLRRYYPHQVVVEAP